MQNLDGIYDAWRISHGSPGVKVAVIDTGVKATHPDLVGKVVGQYNAVTGSHSASDVDGQGTAVASIIGASTNNGIGMAGLGWDTSLLAVRVSDSKGDISDASLARGIDWAVKQGARVINISLYQPESNNALKAAIARAVAKDVVVVATAGDATSGWKTYPAAYPGVLAVSAYTGTGKGPSGSWIDVSAAAKTSVAVAATDGYATVSGSAYATPQIAAIAALLRAAHPDFTAAQVGSAITGTATGVRNRNHPVPLVDAFAALARGLSIPGPTVVSPADGTVITSGETDIQVHLSDFVARDIVRYKFVGQAKTYSSDPGVNQTPDQDLASTPTVCVDRRRCRSSLSRGPLLDGAAEHRDPRHREPCVACLFRQRPSRPPGRRRHLRSRRRLLCERRPRQPLNGVIPVDRAAVGDVQLSAAL